MELHSTHSRCSVDHFSSVQLLSHVWLFVTPWIAAHQASLSITNSWGLLKLMSIKSMMPISSSVIPFSSCLQSSSASGSFPMSQSFASGGQSIALQLYHQSFQWIFRIDLLSDWLIWSPCNPRDSQESYPIAQFKSIKSSALAFFIVQLSHPCMMDLCWQSNVYAF